VKRLRRIFDFFYYVFFSGSSECSDIIMALVLEHSDNRFEHTHTQTDTHMVCGRRKRNALSRLCVYKTYEHKPNSNQ